MSSAESQSICYACGSSLSLTSQAIELLSSSLSGAEGFEDRLLGIEKRNEFVRLDCDIEELDRHIVQVQAALDRLKHDRHVLEASRGRRRSLAAPVNQLPVELLALIFRMSLPLDGFLFMQSPFTLSRVCHLWRVVVLSTPELWSTISIRSPDHTDTWKMKSNWNHVRSPSILTRAVLPRSRDCGLFLCVHLRHIHRDQTKVQLCEALVALAERWQHLDLPEFDPEDTHYFTSVRGRLSSLQYLGVESDRGETICDIFEIAPQLRRVFLADVHPTSIVLPWEQLRDLTWWYLGSPCQAIQVLSICQNLESFHLAPADRKAPSEVRLEYASLTHLCVDARGCGDDRILANLTLPNLRDLTMKSLRGEFKFITAFLQCSQCPLQSLSLINITMDGDDLLHCLRTVPSLTSLVVSRPHWPDHDCGIFLEGLELSQEDQSHLESIVPLLQEFKLLLWSTGRMDVDTFINMIKSRLPLSTNGCLSTVVLGSQDCGEAFELFHVWRDEGLEVHWGADVP